MRLLHRYSLFGLLGLLLITGSSQAQRAGPHGRETLAARMEDFRVAVARDSSVARIADFFPRRSDWTWVAFAADAPRGRPVRQVWRFPGTETLAAIGPRGPVCDAFVAGNSPEGYRLVSSLARALDAYPHWTRRGRRFTPPSGTRRTSWRDRIDNPGPPQGPWWYVDWMLEEGRWVISAFGEEGAYAEPRLPAAPMPNEVTARPRPEPGAEGVRFAEQASWYADNEPIASEGRRYIKYGLPRALPDSLIERVGFRGEVPVFREGGNHGYTAFVYVLASPDGMYQPYETFGDGCRG